MLKRILILLMCLTLSGCALTRLSELIEESTTEEVMTVEDLSDMKYYLNDGWEFYLYHSKLVLIKHTPSGMLIKDVFKVLEE